MTAKPWESLRFVSKVEIVPAPGKKSIWVSLEEDNQYIEFGMGRVNRICQDRKLRLTDETVTFHYEYPDDFKKLVYAMDGDYPKAYEGYLALQKPVPANWEREPKNPWYSTPNDICDKDGEVEVVNG